MALEEQIVAWGASRPAWQRRVLRRVAAGEVLAESDYDQLVEDMLAGEQAPDEGFGLEQFPQTDTGDVPVRLVSIAEPRHTNALESSVPLTFAPAGLTIIYGDNGTGKSGYARLLKRIARARHQEEVLSDVFHDTSLAKPTATLVAKVGDHEVPLAWPEADLSELQRMLFYDAACGEAYIGTESDFPYRPSALFVMDGLIEACTAVQKRIDSRLEANARSAETLPAVDENVRGTEAGKFLAGLCETSSVETLNALIAKLGQTTDTVEDLKGQEVRLRASDPGKERQRLIRQAEKLDSLADHLEELQAMLGDGVLTEMEAQRSCVRSLQDAADVLAQSFESEPLAGVGTSPWKELWESARRFSEAEAYPGEAFPVVGADCRCVLCQQPLKEEGRRRLERFDQFVSDDTQVRLAKARDVHEKRVELVTGIATSPEAVETNLADLEPVHADLVSKTRRLLTEFEEARINITERLAGPDKLPKSGIEVGETAARLREAGAQARAAAAELADPTATEARLEAVTAQRKEIELLQMLRSSRGTVVGQISRLKDRAKLEEAKNSAATGPITRKVSELAEESITEVVRDAFTRETDRLRLERVTVARTRAERGALLHKPKLVDARQAVALPRVFSEGERTALGLAAFFTEARLDASKSALILDDPVSSLDHIRRRLVAARLAVLAEDRQVVVLTHDVSFVADLKQEASGRGVGVAERSVARSRAGERKPGTCGTKHPWKARDVRERLSDLRNELARIKGECDTWDEERYEKEVATWAGNLSETWERIFSQEIVGPVLAEGGLEVRPKMVKVLTQFSDDDEQEFQASYSRVSQWAKRHDKSVKVNYVAPEVSELDSELSSVDAWFKRVKGYKNQ